VGPLFHPGQTACWECLNYRLEGHQVMRQYLEMTRPTTLVDGVEDSGIPATVTLAVALASTALTTGDLPDLVTFDIAEFETRRHTVIRRPHCPSCGTPPPAPAPLRLQHRRLEVDPAGKPRRRWRSLTDIRKTLEPHISPHTGIITSLQEIGTGTDLFYTYGAGHDFPVSTRHFDTVVKTLKGSLSGGKGRTREQAEVSALCEAVERGLSVYRGDEAREAASRNEMGSRALDWEALAQFSDTQYRDRERLNATSNSRFAFVPGRLDPSRGIDWTRVEPALGGQERYVPTAYCYYGHPDVYNDPFCASDSNGTAAGGCLEEAIMNGFTELIERDSVALWWYNRLRRPAVDLSTVDDEYLQRVIQFHKTLGRNVWALDVTTDSKVPCFVMVSAAIGRPEGQPQDIMVSFGCDFEPANALASAVDELNQFVPFILPDDAGKVHYWGAGREMRDWLRGATLSSEPYLVPDPDAEPTQLADLANLGSGDLFDDVITASGIARRLGSEMYVLDLTRPEVDLSVARVLVPGLRHFWRRLGPGRLYDTPVALGWLDRPTPEDDLNPITVFF
jgi:ribosomal protein S12 methylthiotransferase accessory factor